VTTDALAGLAARLTDPTDRETYAALLLYRDSLPPGDEVRQMLHLFGLLSLLGQRLPDALAESMAQMRQLTERAGEYYGDIDERLANLPAEITAGVDVSAITRTMGEAFRNHISESGLEASAAHLRATTLDMTALMAKIKPLSQEYKGLADSIAAGVSKLTAASAELQAGKPVEPNRSSWPGHPLLLLVMLLVGVVAGMSWDRFVQ
jgi:hypothetical protein